MVYFDYGTNPVADPNKFWFNLPGLLSHLARIAGRMSTGKRVILRDGNLSVPHKTSKK